MASETEVEVDAAADRWVVVRLQAPYGAAAPGSHPVQLEVRSLVDGAIQVQAKTTFLVPR
ncbi:Ubp3 associated protein Bre5 [compost metagenome]